MISLEKPKVFEDGSPRAGNVLEDGLRPAQSLDLMRTGLRPLVVSLPTYHLARIELSQSNQRLIKSPPLSARSPISSIPACAGSSRLPPPLPLGWPSSSSAARSCVPGGEPSSLPMPLPLSAPAASSASVYMVMAAGMDSETSPRCQTPPSKGAPSPEGGAGCGLMTTVASLSPPLWPPLCATRRRLHLPLLLPLPIRLCLRRRIAFGGRSSARLYEESIR